MQAKDYYKILNVSESADGNSIKRAYRELAKKNHPDANPGNKAAETRFKEASEAYSVLSNVTKRREYDQMRRFGGFNPGGFRGNPGAGFGGFDFSNFRNAGTRRQAGGSFNGESVFGNLGGLGSLFSQIFDMGGQAKKRPRNRGENINLDLRIRFKKSIVGGHVSFSIEKEIICTTCQGGGAKPGSTIKSCHKCQGTGQVFVNQGGFGVSQPCSHCYGKGQIIDNPCDKCSGSGRIKGPRKYSVKIASGIEDGHQIKLKGEGQMGPEGKPPGDLIVTIKVTPHHFFRRMDLDVLCRVPLTLKQAVEGTKIRVKTVDGRKVDLKIPSGTQHGTRFKLNGLGVVKGANKGAQLVSVQVDLPIDPSNEEKELLKQYREAGSSAAA
ncbi:DnaJ domain-containing protein [bacterium]|nr:DnaJ domain-containing protein [bacterium]